MCNVSVCDYHVIMLTETNLSIDITDAELGMPDYNIFRKDRSTVTSDKMSFGGVLIAVHKSISSRLVQVEESVEQVYVTVGSGRGLMIFGCIYLPPSSPSTKYLLVSDSVDGVVDAFPDSEIYILGDFNLPKAVWTDEDLCSVAVARDDLYLPPNTLDSIRTVSDLCAFHNLYQLNHIYNINNVVLDLVLGHSRCNVQPCQPLVNIDLHHPPLSINIVSSQNIIPGRRAEALYYDFKSANYSLINDFLASISWDDLFFNKGVDDMVNIFYDILYDVLSAYVPVKRVASRKFPIWFSRELISLTIQKKVAHKKYKAEPSALNYSMFSNLRTQCSILSKQCYRNYVQKTENALENNVKQFWSYVNSKRRSNDIPNTLSLDNVNADMGPDAANLFAEYFSSVYSNVEYDYAGEISPNNINVNIITISISDIYTELSLLNPNRGPGPDNIHPLFLKNCSFILARPLHLIFNESLNQGLFPSFWKTCFVVPIHKAGDKSNVKNYRPISISDAIPKVFEKLVTKQLSTVFNPIIVNEQFGFCPYKNTELNLLTYTNYISEALETGVEVHSVYTDFTKAFDRVPHKLLLGKLDALGVSGAMLDWIGSYLGDRSQVVRVNNFLSNEIMVPSGVPQGSHIGPLLFNLYVNDVSTCFTSCKFLMFADDLKVFRTVCAPEDCRSLQGDLDGLVSWCLNNGMELNVSKCKFMRFTRLRRQMDYNYTIKGEILSSTNSMKDLGVMFDPQLSFVEHITSVTTKSLQMLGFIKRNSKDFSSINSLKILYFSLVRSYLDYASSVWNPFYDTHTLRLERVQSKFLRYINYKFFGNDAFSYSGLCHGLNLLSLSSRRRKHDLLLFFKLLNSLVVCPELLTKIGLHAPPRNTRSNQTFAVPFHRTNYGSHSFITRVSSLANQLNNLNFFCPLKQFLKELSRIN